MLRTYKYRIYPTPNQQQKLNRSIGVCRFVYNLALERKKEAWQSRKENLSAFDLCKQLPKIKEAYPWICEVNSQAVQSAILNMSDAFQNFFKGRAGFPRFKKRRNGGSFQCPQFGKIDWNQSTLTIPKIKNIPIVLDRKFEGKIKKVTISRTPSGKYFASILVNNDLKLPQLPVIKSETTLGLDMGIKSFVVTSDGRSYAPNRYLKNSLQRLRILQRRASHKKKGSNNRKKANLKVARIYEKITNQRVDYCHKITTELIRENQTETIVIEDLAVSNMVKNRKLSRAISDVAWGEFFRQLKYKCEWYGKNLITIGRFDPSSKRCSSCGEINKPLMLSERKWTCSCGSAHDRDENAAKNIKWFGLEQARFKNNSGEGISDEPVES